MFNDKKEPSYDAKLDISVQFDYTNQYTLFTLCLKNVVSNFCNNFIRC